MRAGRASGPLDWSLLFRAAMQRLRLPKAEIGRMTYTQLMVALDSSDPNDPHAGGIEVSSLDQLDDLW